MLGDLNSGGLVAQPADADKNSVFNVLRTSQIAIHVIARDAVVK